MLKTVSVAALAALGVCALTSNAYAVDTIATISGSYDLAYYDTPALTFHVDPGITLHNMTMHLQGYQGLNNGVSLNITLGDITSGDTTFIWGFLPGVSGATTPGNLAAYDYDDEWGNYPPGYTNPGCVVGGGLCALVGNFSVTLNGTVLGGIHSGAAITSYFTPSSNATGGFVGWEGLDPDGLSESIYDQHSGSLTGTLAVITLGTTGVPEPSTWAMMLAGFAGLGFAGFRSRRRSLSPIGA